MTAFYIYAKKIKAGVFVMAKHRVLGSLFQRKVHDEILAQEHYKCTNNCGFA